MRTRSAIRALVRRTPPSCLLLPLVVCECGDGGVELGRVIRVAHRQHPLELGRLVRPLHRLVRRAAASAQHVALRAAGLDQRRWLRLYRLVWRGVAARRRSVCRKLRHRMPRKVGQISTEELSRAGIEGDVLEQPLHAQHRTLQRRHAGAVHSHTTHNRGRGARQRRRLGRRSAGRRLSLWLRRARRRSRATQSGFSFFLRPQHRKPKLLL
mmetsp:Transcript_37588/g.120810  ORF Transcript_37588/g.120810 Transcript_37588/m.120810 type:complete len:211 (+) Transcript_37588:115-747(+)